MTELDLPYGDTTVRVSTAAPVTVVRPPAVPPPPPLAPLLSEALAAPIGRALSVRPSERVLVILSDATRDEPRAAFLDALRAVLPPVRLTLAYATGTHGPTRPLVETDLPVINHDGVTDTVLAGTTSRGTPVRVHRAVLESDLVICTGVIRPHYFAGFGAGAKAIFPGLAESTAARINHRLKEHPSSRAGNVLGECRLDLEEAARLAAPNAFLLNGVADTGNQIQAAVAGDVVEAFRAGAALASAWCRVTAPRAPAILVADHPPVTDSLYQASKLVAAVAHLLLPGGTVFVLAPCPAGIGPLETVNRGIYEIGLRPRLPSPHAVRLISSLPAAAGAPSYAAPATLAELASHPGPLLVVPRASKLILDAMD